MNSLLLPLILSVVLATIPATLSYDEFAVKDIYHGKTAEPDLSSHPRAKIFRTELRKQVKHGPNFAGHYTVIRLGCGTGCAMIAIVDAKTGRVFFPESVKAVQWSGWWHEPFGPEYRLNSRLFIVYGQVNDNEEAQYGVSYYEWTGSDFTFLRFEQHDPGGPPR